MAASGSGSVRFQAWPQRLRVRVSVPGGKVRGERGARATGSLLINRWKPGVERVRRGRGVELGRYSHGRYSVKEKEILQKPPCLFSVFSV